MKKLFTMPLLFVTLSFGAFAQNTIAPHFTLGEIRDAFKNPNTIQVGQLSRVPTFGSYVKMADFHNGTYTKGEPFFLFLYVFQINSTNDGSRFFYYCYPLVPVSENGFYDGEMYLVETNGRVEGAVRFGPLIALATYMQNYNTTMSDSNTGEHIKVSIPVFSAVKAVTFVTAQ